MITVIPMAGEGSRFRAAGYELPKPFIDVLGKPMISRVIESLPKSDKTIFICRKQHLEEYPWFASALLGLTESAEIVTVDHLTEGAACTVLLAEHLINNDEELIIANSDQEVIFDHMMFDSLRRADQDGIIFLFTANHPKWSYAQIQSGKVVHVAEKTVISHNATCGIYYFKRGADYVGAANNMIRKNQRTNGEFYNAPVYNELINVRMEIMPFFVKQMYGLGTPEDLTIYKEIHG